MLCQFARTIYIQGATIIKDKTCYMTSDTIKITKKGKDGLWETKVQQHRN